MSIKHHWHRIFSSNHTSTHPTSDFSSSSSTYSSSPTTTTPTIKPPKPTATEPSPQPKRSFQIVRSLTVWSKTANRSSTDSERRIWSRKPKPKRLSAKAKGKAPEILPPRRHPGDRPLSETNLQHQEMLGRWSWAAGYSSPRGSMASETNISPGASPRGEY